MHFDSLKSQNFAILSVVIEELITALSDELKLAEWINRNFEREILVVSKIEVIGFQR